MLNFPNRHHFRWFNRELAKHAASKPPPTASIFVWRQPGCGGQGQRAGVWPQSQVSIHDPWTEASAAVSSASAKNAAASDS